MGLFRKKDKSAHASPALPDTSAQSNNPYAYSPPPPSYVSQPSYNEPSSYGRQRNEPSSYGSQRNEPTSYGGSGYGKGNLEPNAYGGSSASSYGGGRKTPEPTPYGGSKISEPAPYGGSRAPEPNSYGRSSSYGSSRTQEPTSYGASVYSNNNRPSDQSSSNPYGGPSQYNRQPNPQQPQRGAQETYSSQSSGSYNYSGGGYQDSSYSYQTTAFAEDEQDPEMIKQEIKFTKYASHASTVNALHAAARAEQAGQSTLLSLDQQGEKLYDTQLNLKIAKTHGEISAQQAKDLKVANRPLFMPHVKNPFSSGANKAMEEQVSLERQRRERAERPAKATHNDKMRKMGLAPVGAPKPISAEEKAARARQRSMYQFEADEEDEELERGIEDNLDQLAGASGRLKGMAYAINQKVEEQNKLILEIGDQAHEVEDGLTRTSHKLRPYGF